MRLQRRYKFFVDTLDHHRRVFAKVNSGRNAILFAFRVRRLPSTSTTLPAIRGFHRCEKLSERTERCEIFTLYANPNMECLFRFLCIFFSSFFLSSGTEERRTTAKVYEQGIRHTRMGLCATNRLHTHTHTADDVTGGEAAHIQPKIKCISKCVHVTQRD